MTALSFNIRIIIISFFLSAGLVLVYFSLLKEAREYNWFNGNIKKYNLISLPILFIFIIFIIASSFTSLASNNDEEQEIFITNISEYGGFGGFEVFSSYTIEGKNDSGEEIIVHVSLLMPNSFKRRIEELSTGDVITVKYTKGLNFLYYYEKRA